jgi:hypothetical protein
MGMNSFTFSSLNWLYELFYINKMISSEIINYLTPMSIAFLLMVDGGWVALVYTLALGCVKAICVIYNAV